MDLLPPISPVWRRIRRYAVPATMIAAAAERREAGDWRGACAAANVAVDESVTAVTRRYGREAAARIEADLAGLAPDLLRWHLARQANGRIGLATTTDCQLSAAPGTFDDDTAMLTVDVPESVDGSQRLRLSVRGHDRRSIDLPPAVWSAPHVHELRDLYGGSKSRMPRFTSDGTPADGLSGPDEPVQRTEAILGARDAGRLAEAWRLAGIGSDGQVLPDRDDIGRADYAGRVVGAWREWHWISPVSVAAELSRLRRRYGRTAALLKGARRELALVDLSALDRPRIRSHHHGSGARVTVFLPPPDLDLVWYGLIRHEDLHPLVLGALFPHRPPAPSTAGVWPPARDVLVPTRVRCGGAWHPVGHEGRLSTPAHTDAERHREATLRGLGGTSSGCFAVAATWRDGAGRLPKALAAMRREVRYRIQHGGAAALTELLDAGLDPHLRDARGHSLLHQLGAVDPTELLPRLLAAGVPVDVRDRLGRTPLYVAVQDGGPPGFVDALLRGGADPNARNDDGDWPLRLARARVHRAHAFGSEPTPDRVRILEVLEKWAA